MGQASSVGLFASLLAIGLVSAAAQSATVFESDAGMVLTYVRTDKIADFERLLDQFHGAIRQTEDPIRRQQAQAWKIFRMIGAQDEDAVLYVSVMDPVVKGASYDIIDILTDEMEEEEADRLVEIWRGTLARPAAAFNLDLTDDFGSSRRLRLPRSGSAPIIHSFTPFAR